MKWTPTLELLEEKGLDLGATSWAALAITPQKESRQGITGPDPAVLSWACTFQQEALSYAWGWLHPHILRASRSI